MRQSSHVKQSKLATKFSEEYLSFQDEYEMNIKQPDLFEQQEKEEIEVLNSIEALNCSFKRHSLGSICISGRSTNVSYDISTELLKDNFYAYDKTVKIMLVGNKGVGKTTFLNSVVGHIDTIAKGGSRVGTPIPVLKDSSTKPTLSLEFNKRLVKVNNKLVNLEFWDTNEQVLNSPVIKSIYSVNPFSLPEDMPFLYTYYRCF
jgi:ATPase subunit of ABC transporter with duplicated ATPase domains